ncbi:MAG: neutral/alkaline non-lysosomal ceramidase N-terminal domain-containing protein [Opitutaceae bacterium]|nr:neutral/alkaline non-lysosomal ceramidase N-terminal domain-containing protein [Opitutaceae bacterium]
MKIPLLIRSRLFILAAGLLVLPSSMMPAPVQSVPVGAARIDITPQWPIRLAGYANRRGTDWKVEMPLHARALAIGEGANAAVLVTVELVGISSAISDSLASELEHSNGLKRDHVTVCAIHTHSGPAIAGYLVAERHYIPADERAAMIRYTSWLQERLREVAEAALADRQPARLSWAQGYAGFAVNRRELKEGKWKRFGVVPNGPADRTLPVLVAQRDDGRIRAVLTSYACHCTANGGGMIIHPDWAGEASAQIESDNPGAVALVALGCAGDVGPYPKNGIEAARTNGREVAAEVARLVAKGLTPLPGVTAAAYRIVNLPLDKPDNKGVLEQVPLPVQSWAFGKDLTMIFLGGEMASDYSLRLRRELDADRLWINAYSNSVPCYVASHRMYPEGGYEVDASMLKYGWSGRLAAGTEDRIIAAVHEQVEALGHGKGQR